MTKPRAHLLAIAALFLLLAVLPATGSAAPGILGSQDFEYARLRGFDLGSNLTLSDEDLIAMRRHGANVARFLIDARRADGTEVYKVSPEALAAVDRYAEFGASHGFRLVIALQPQPADWDQQFWSDPLLRSSIVSIWEALAERYRCNEAIVGYDLINEPIATVDKSRALAFSTAGANMWTGFAAEIIQKIRRFDPNHAIILEPSPGALPEAFDYIEHAITDRNVVYSVHMYEPHALTHQGISSFRSFTYPGVSLSLGYWGKRKIAAALEPVRRFAASSGVPIFVGEFSIVRWAPQQSAVRYLADLLAIIDDQEGWSWTYQAWRECECWDAEITSSFYQQFPYDAGRPKLPKTMRPAEHRTADADGITVLSKYLARNGNHDIMSPGAATREAGSNCR